MITNENIAGHRQYIRALTTKVVHYERIPATRNPLYRFTDSNDSERSSGVAGKSRDLINWRIVIKLNRA
jgi:hypothetical protein